MGERQLILENQLGQVIRTFRWKANSLVLVHRFDTGRVEALTDTKELEDRGIDFEVLVDTSPGQLESHPIQLTNGGRLRWTQSISQVSPSITIAEENQEQYKTILKWTAIGQSAFLALILILGWAVLPLFQEDEVVVTIKPQEEIRKPLPPAARQVVQPTQEKIKKRRVVKNRKVVNRKVKPVKATKYAKKSKAKPTKNANLRRSVNVRKMGALGALGGTPNGLKGSRGLNLRAAGKGSDAGLSGAGGSGGLYKQVATNGLISGPVGNGKGAGAGGYGTRGKGGGRSGYGKMSMAGSSNGFSQPLYEEALIEGGLDRDQIAAVINRHLGQVIYCYEKGLQKEPDLRGRISVKFVIGGNGRVQRAGLANSSLQDAKVEGCILSKLRNWKFPQPVGRVDVKVTYPFVLKRLSQG